MKPQGIDWQARAIQFLFLAAVAAAWYFIGRAELVNSIFLPELPRVLDKFWQILHTSRFYENLRVTLFELACAFAIASTLGLLVGYLVGRSRYATLVFEPLLAGIFAVPLVVFLPLFILFFGIGMESKIAFGASYAFFPIVLNTIGGISQVDPRFVTVAKSMGATEGQMFRRVLLPAALPLIVTGLRIGCTIAFLSILGAETISGLRGLGSRISNLAEGMNTPEMFAYILFVILMAFILNITLTMMQKRFSAPEQRA
jgi:ABC-type nitrate/sulfonate/bicarbonate transport system permease component